MGLPMVFDKSPASLADLVERKPRALRVGEVASLLNVSERLVYRMASERSIPSFRVCGSVRFDPAVLAHWLRKRARIGE